MATDFSNASMAVVGKVHLHMAGHEGIIADVDAVLIGSGSDQAIVGLLVGAAQPGT